MLNERDFGFTPSFDGNDQITQEAAYNAASSRYSDLFDAKLTSFNPEAIVTGGNNQLKSGLSDMEIEESDLKLGYRQPEPATDPKPGRFFLDD